LIAPVYDATPPLVEHLAVTQALVGTPIRITATITDPSGVEYVALWFREVGIDAFQAIPMRPDGGDVYAAEIPAQSRPGTVEYHILAVDRWQNLGREPAISEHAIGVGLASPLSGLPIALLAVLIGVSTAVSVVLVLFVLARRRRRFGEKATNPPEPKAPPP
jgi:hypothetical protein